MVLNLDGHQHTNKMVNNSLMILQISYNSGIREYSFEFQNKTI
jgi:hypothetical protein